MSSHPDPLVELYETVTILKHQTTALCNLLEPTRGDWMLLQSKINKVLGNIAIMHQIILSQSFREEDKDS